MSGFNRRPEHPDAGKIVRFKGSTISLTPRTDSKGRLEDWWANLPETPYRILEPFPGVFLPEDAVYIKIDNIGHWISDSQIVRTLP
jgi:hypothetical protein